MIHTPLTSSVPRLHHFYYVQIPSCLFSDAAQLISCLPFWCQCISCFSRTILKSSEGCKSHSCVHQPGLFALFFLLLLSSSKPCFASSYFCSVLPKILIPNLLLWRIRSNQLAGQWAFFQHSFILSDLRSFIHNAFSIGLKRKGTGEGRTWIGWH